MAANPIQNDKTVGHDRKSFVEMATATETQNHLGASRLCEYGIAVLLAVGIVLVFALPADPLVPKMGWERPIDCHRYLWMA